MQGESVDLAFARETLIFLEEDNHFGEHLALSIKQSLKSTSQLAKLIGVTPSAISQWCHGDRFPDSGKVFQIAKALGLTEQQEQSLMIAWSSTRSFRGYIEYVKAAIDENDLESVRKILDFTID